MTKNNKSDNPHLALITALHSFKTHLQDFVDQPTNQNLDKLNKLASIYTDAWIQHNATDDVFTKLIPSQMLASDFSHDFQDSTKSLQNFLDKNPSEREEYLKLEELIKNTWGGEEYYEWMADADDEDFKIQGENTFSKRTTAALKEELSHLEVTPKAYSRKGPDRLTSREIARVESPDKKLKILSYSVFLPAGRYGNDELKIDELDFIQHSIRATRISDGDSRALNRRWYFEKADRRDPNSNKVAWWADREQFREMLSNGAEQGMFKQDFNDQRIKSYELKLSLNLSDNEKQEILKTFTFPEERAQLNQDGYFFITAQSQYPKAPSQLSDKSFHENAYLWNDVAIVSPNSVTIRSSTNDQLHKPSEKIVDSSWVISNDMTSLSNQIMREFIPLIYPGLKID